MSNRRQSYLDQERTIQHIQAVLESQKLICKVTSTCFNRCVPSPGAKLSYSQQTCMWQCSQRYIETQHFISKRSADMRSAGAGDGVGGPSFDLSGGSGSSDSFA
uniref:Mitochondrial import inner membrane translocase subunit n=1 Tax=Chromera velia CCMP2878 TaxID=1169474 RepID=A0A0G4FK47_9ALVE|eukprot:Cvel_17297.t1-p1 / transcript=Cvel_17297.t1 / gene=Cvel_17297 / organism=Chromera_velia_CCMP2878 / gene_product=Mitochondrial import inner membrane translocase, putative / transcript_product=Mitochondrial import inner membrane translocase, putative / location=Cvel_scaffold1373:21027-21421(-) / protein_length=103 / sequence_SO=supercontig / SO=protein_coding / is_pseudo=false